MSRDRFGRRDDGICGSVDLSDDLKPRRSEEFTEPLGFDGTYGEDPRVGTQSLTNDRDRFISGTYGEFEAAAGGRSWVEGGHGLRGGFQGNFLPAEMCRHGHDSGVLDFGRGGQLLEGEDRDAWER